MKTKICSLFSLSFTAILLSASAQAAVKTYQVTGPILNVTADSLTVQKGKETWEIAKPASAPADLKVGDKVTVVYSMTATKIEKKK